MLSDIIENAVASQPDMQVVGEVTDRGAMLHGMSELRPDVVMLALPNSEVPAECEALFDADRYVSVLGVAAGGRRAYLYQLHPRTVPLGEVSPQGLLDAIRMARRPEKPPTA